MEEILEALATHATDARPVSEVDRRLELLLADFLACAFAARDRPSGTAFSADGVSGVTALLAMRASAHDLDDVDWRSVHHPGSVVWPVVVALAAQDGVTGPLLGTAARSGYATAATIADRLGPPHRAHWHVTATAGALGAASAASVMMGLPPDQHALALSLAGANAGGLAVSARERRGAAIFNRSAAATLGLVAARAASAGAIAVAAPIGGSGGLVDLTSSRTTSEPFVLRDGILDAAPRLFPVTGFLQSAVAAVAELRAGTDGDLREMRIGLTPGAVPMVTSDDELPWWDARLSAVRAWAGESPYAAGTPCGLDGGVDLVQIVDAVLPLGQANVTVAFTDGEESIQAAEPPSLSTPDAMHDLTRKWSRVLGVDSAEMRELARAVLAESDQSVELARMWSR